MCVDMISGKTQVQYPLVTADYQLVLKDNLKGVVDLVSNKAIRWRKMKAQELKGDVVDIPEDLKDQSSEYRLKLIEKAVEEDDSIMEKYLDGDEPTTEELKIMYS